MDRVAMSIGLLAAAAALGALAVAELVVAPGLASATGYIDANLAKTLTAPMHQRCAQIVFVACIVLALCTPRMIVSRVGTTAALCAVGCVALYRFVMLPRLYEAWSRVDLVAGKPEARIADAQGLADQTLMLAGALAALLVTIVVLAAWSRPLARKAAPAKPAPEPATATPAPTSA
jgi:hypothetical protein